MTASNKFSDIIEVAKTISNVRVDIALSKNSSIRLIEFHEEQHRSLSVGKLLQIFSNNTGPIKIPKYAQRFLKDIWRYKYLNQFQIIGWDWFYLNIDDSTKLILDNPKQKEFYCANKFSFVEFNED